ncbi:hypothetical protein KY289_012786 [Solanum tuberosum]|nr:hypothetical protein KY289_012786 [Solanum tuberosum]
MPNTRSKGAPLVPFDPELRKTICKMVNALEFEAQRHRFGLEAETIANGVQPNGVNNDPRAVDENIAVDGIIPPYRQPIAPRGRPQPPAHMMYEEDDIDLDGVVATGATLQHLMNIVAICKSQEIYGVSQTTMRLSKRDKERDQDMAHMRTQIDLLTKHIVSKSKKVNVVGQPNRYEDQDIDLDEEANYLGNQGGRNYSREGQYDRPINREQGN